MIRQKKLITRYRISRAVHWAVFFAISMSTWFAYYHMLISREDYDFRQELMAQHIGWSWIATGLVTLRIVWHLFNRTPKKTGQVSRLIKAYNAANVVMRWVPFLITATGAGIIWSAGRDVLAFGFPVVTGLAEQSPDLQGAMEMAHSGLWYLFAALLIMHVIVALEK